MAKSKSRLDFEETIFFDLDHLVKLVDKYAAELYEIVLDEACDSHPTSW